MYTSTNLVIIFTYRAFVMMYMDIIVSGYITKYVVFFQIFGTLLLMAQSA